MSSDHRHHKLRQHDVRHHRPRQFSSGKGQMEIMGLMIIVILLVLGVLFALKFVVLKEPSDVRQSYTKTQTAANLGIALMSSTTADCRHTDLKTLIIDCAEGREYGGGITCDDRRRKSCEYVNDTVSYIVDNTLKAWNQKYYVIAGTGSGLGQQILYVHSDDCLAFTASGQVNEQPGESESFFLPMSGGLVTLKIFICN